MCAHGVNVGTYPHGHPVLTLIRFTDLATPTRKAKPKGTIGAELRLKLVDAGAPQPTYPEALTFLALSTNG
jgi:hypothetical protein